MQVDTAIRFGLRQLADGSSLAQNLIENRWHRNIGAPRLLTMALILR
jgi:hypothetical protein